MHTKTASAKKSTVKVRITDILECDDEMPQFSDHIHTAIREVPFADQHAHANHHSCGL